MRRGAHPADRTLPFWALFGFVTIILSGCAVTATLGQANCPDEFRCIVIDAPLDHHNPDDGQTIEVVFAMRPADDVPRGVLVTAVGGPGGSGLEAAGFEPLGMDQDILDNFDLVYFDQRGLWTFSEPSCPEADADYYDSYVALPVDDPERVQGLIEINGTYNEACIAEAGDSHVLPYLGTEQVARDLEMFREAEGYQDLIIYGQSYGTAVAQEYAGLFPDRVDRLVLDGPLDRTRDSLQLTGDQISGIDGVLEMMFESCDSDEQCATDMGMPANDAYTRLIERLVEDPAMVRFPVEPDVFEKQKLLAEDVSYLAFANGYFEGDRLLFLRALAAANGGDLVPMLRLYSSADSGVSSTVNLAVSCLDNSTPGNDEAEDSQSVLEARGQTTPEQRWQYEFNLACVHWPNTDHERVPEQSFAGAGIPTLIIASEADPATPYSQALSLRDQLEDGRLLTVSGGSHVMFGRGNFCVDDHVTGFIVDGTAEPTVICDAPVVDPYIGLIPTEGTDDELFTGIDNDLAYLPELLYWDGFLFMEVGCTNGGQASFTGTDTTTDYDLADCAFRPDLVVSGDGHWDYEAGRTDLTATIAGDPCTYTFRQDWGEALGSVSTSCP